VLFKCILYRYAAPPVIKHAADYAGAGAGRDGTPRGVSLFTWTVLAVINRTVF
jgi:hypothetical protein